MPGVRGGEVYLWVQAQMAADEAEIRHTLHIARQDSWSVDFVNRELGEIQTARTILENDPAAAAQIAWEWYRHRTGYRDYWRPAGHGDLANGTT